MTQVGMRELRHRLREFLARVEAGEGFEVTVFGRPVAELRPVATGRPSLARLTAEGRITPPVDPDTSRIPSPVEQTTTTSATDALLLERREDAR